MKLKQKLLASSLIGLTSLALIGNASASKFYLGAGLGYTALNTPSGDAFTVEPDNGSTTYMEDSSSTDIGGFGGTIFAGYNFAENWAVELGYTGYADSEYKSQQTEYESNVAQGTSNASLKYTTHTYDLFVRGNLPVTDKFGAFAKAGLSYVNQDVDYTPGTDPTIPINSGNFTTPKTGSHTYTAFRPAGGLGFDFKLNKEFSAQVFAQGFLGSGDFDSDQDAIASGYLVGAGITFTFV